MKLPARARSHRVLRRRAGARPRGRGRAGVPVLELAPGDQYQRIIEIGALVGRNDIGGDEAAAPPGSRETLGEYHRLAGVALIGAGIGDAAFALEPLPGDSGNARHGLAHFVEYLRYAAVRALVVPGEPQALGHLLDDP